MSLATLTKTGRAALVLAVRNSVIHLAWGAGDPSWDEEGAEIPSYIDSTGLVSEVGRRLPSYVGFVEPDENGEIEIPVGMGAQESVEVARYREVEQPTPYLYVRARFDYADASNAVIREMAVFLDTKVKEDLPPGQRYFTPDQLADPGLLLAAQVFIPPINRNPSIRQSVEFVLTV